MSPHPLRLAASLRETPHFPPPPGLPSRGAGFSTEVPFAPRSLAHAPLPHRHRRRHRP
jgi:hypothetical protein